MSRCPWAEVSDLDRQYHDQEWGVPVRDDCRLFEMLTLEGAQAGLSWTTVLAKRNSYRRLFCGFEPQKVARFTPQCVEKLLADASIIRHRGKVESTVSNARAVLDVQAAEGTLADYLWAFVDGEPVTNHFQTSEETPTQTAESTAMSKDLKRRGFGFVGPTTCYAFMQAAGMVNDHLTSCPRHASVARFSRP